MSELPIITIEDADGESRTYRVRRAKVNIPPHGVMTAEEFISSKSVLTTVLLNPELYPVLEEVPEEEDESGQKEEPGKPADKTSKAKKD